MKKTIPHALADWIISKTAYGKAAVAYEQAQTPVRLEREKKERAEKRELENRVMALMDAEERRIKKETQDNAPAQINNNVLTFLNKLRDAGFKNAGVEITPLFEIHTLETSERGIQIWIHKAGDLFRIYQHVNDNNLTSLLNTLVNPDSRIELAHGALDRAMQRINKKIAIENGAIDLEISHMAPDAEIGFYEDCIAGAARQLRLAE